MELGTLAMDALVGCLDLLPGCCCCCWRLASFRCRFPLKSPPRLELLLVVVHCVVFDGDDSKVSELRGVGCGGKYKMKVYN